MADYRLKMGETLNIDVSIGGGAADSGVSYTISGGGAGVASVSNAGVVTPIGPGLVVVQAKNAAGTLLRSFAIEIVSVAQAALEKNLLEGDVTLVNTATATGDEVIAHKAETGFNVKNTTMNSTTAATPASPSSVRAIPANLRRVLGGVFGNFRRRS